MSFEVAQRLSEILLALALTQASLEHLIDPTLDRRIFIVRIAACGVLLSGFAPTLALTTLFGLALILLNRFQGPYNGGSDKMGLLVLTCLLLTHVLPEGGPREFALAYLAAQLVLCYFVSGWIKIIKADWRSGLALSDVFRYSAYPVHEALRKLADWRWFLWMMSWAVMILEVAFPLALMSQTTLLIALSLTAAFHLSNAIIFGLNRFFWIWLAAYPPLIWFQDRVFGI